MRHRTTNVVSAPSAATTSGTLIGRFALRPITRRPTIVIAARTVMKISRSVVLNDCQALTDVSNPALLAASDSAPLTFRLYQLRNMSTSSSSAAPPAIFSPLLRRLTSTGSPPSGYRTARSVRRAPEGTQEPGTGRGGGGV